MPNWNMGVQDLVNKWVKVNKTHVVYLNENDKKALPSTDQQQQHHQQSRISSYSSTNDKNNDCGGGGAGRIIKPSSALRKHSYNNNNKSNYSKTLNAQKQQQQQQQQGDDQLRNSAKVHHTRRRQDSSSWTTKTGTTITTATTGSHAAARTGRCVSLVRTHSQSDLLKETFYDDEAGVDNAKQQQQQAHSKLSRNYRRSKKKQREKQPPPVELLVDDGMSKKQPESSGIQQQQQPIQPPYPTHDHHPPSSSSSDNRDHHHCDTCHHMQHQIQIMTVDIQSLRSLALKYEQQQQFLNLQQQQHDAQSVGTDASSSVVRFKKSKKKRGGGVVISAASSIGTSESRGSATVYNEPASVAEASQRLDDVTVRHKRQVELMAKERIRWQNDMQLKLSKFALMAKELNEESAMRKRESQAALDELSIATSERDALSFQVEQLQAQLATQERYQRENDILRHELIQRDDGLLNRCHDAIEKRDGIIRELTNRLRVTMMTLEREREVQRSRRIIFPSARLQQQRLVSDESSIVDRTTTTDEDTSASAEEMEIRELKERLIQMKQSENLARLELEDFKSKALKTEDMLRGRCQRLQDQLTGNSKERILRCGG